MIYRGLTITAHVQFNDLEVVDPSNEHPAGYVIEDIEPDDVEYILYDVNDCIIDGFDSVWEAKQYVDALFNRNEIHDFLNKD